MCDTQCHWIKTIKLFNKCCGLEDREIVGEVHYCTHPEQAASLPIIDEILFESDITKIHSIKCPL